MTIEFHKQEVLMFDIYVAPVLVHAFDSNAGRVLFVYFDEVVESCVHILFIFISSIFYGKS